MFTLFIFTAKKQLLIGTHTNQSHVEAHLCSSSPPPSRTSVHVESGRNSWVKSNSCWTADQLLCLTLEVEAVDSPVRESLCFSWC